MLIVSFYGGLFSVLPAYIADVFGQKVRLERGTATAALVRANVLLLHLPLCPRVLGSFLVQHVGAIHGRALTAWSAAAIGGPVLLTNLRGRAYNAEAHKLAEVCETEAFLHAFGAPISELNQLLDSHTVTIAQLLEVCVLPFCVVLCP